MDSTTSKQAVFFFSIIVVSTLLLRHMLIPDDKLAIRSQQMHLCPKQSRVNLASIVVVEHNFIEEFVFSLSLFVLLDQIVRRFQFVEFLLFSCLLLFLKLL